MTEPILSMPPTPSTSSSQRFFEARPNSVRQAREFVTETLNRWSLRARTEDIRLCVSELATNAVIHGTVPGRGFIVRLVLSENDDLVRLEVHDSRRRQPFLHEPAATDLSGRGLILVAALSDGWGVEERATIGKIVWSCFKDAGGEAPG
ncbi:ATP-binding protein [Streptomyces formicae]